MPWGSQRKKKLKIFFTDLFFTYFYFNFSTATHYLWGFNNSRALLFLLCKMQGEAQVKITCTNDLIKGVNQPNGTDFHPTIMQSLWKDRMKYLLILEECLNCTGIPLIHYKSL